MLDYLIPRATTVANHPLFHMEMRRRRKEQPLPVIVKHNLTRVSIICGGMLGLWIFACTDKAYALYTVQGTVNNGIFDTSQQLLKWLLFVGIGANIWLDFSALIASVGEINRERITGQWHLLSLANLGKIEVITVKHIVAQIQVLPIATMIIGMRIATIIIAAVQLAGEYLWANGFPRLELVVYFAIFSPALLPFWYIVFRLALAYCNEPLWRLRTVTAIGVAISARVKGVTSAILAGLGAVAFMWILQGAIIALLAQLVLGIGESAVQVCVATLCLGPMFAMSLYLYYTILQAWCLHRANHDAFRE